MGFWGRREIVEDFGAGGGMAEGFGLAGVEETVAALGNAFEGEMA